jgi:hypothetical protein
VKTAKKIIIQALPQSDIAAEGLAVFKERAIPVMAYNLYGVRAVCAARTPRFTGWIRGGRLRLSKYNNNEASTWFNLEIRIDFLVQ